MEDEHIYGRRAGAGVPLTRASGVGLPSAPKGVRCTVLAVVGLSALILGTTIWYSHLRPLLSVPSSAPSPPPLISPLNESPGTTRVFGPSAATVLASTPEPDKPHAAHSLWTTGRARAFRARRTAEEAVATDELVLYANDLVNLGGTEAFVELHQILRVEPEGDRRRLLADVAAQWRPEPGVLPIALETLEHETDQEVLRSVKAMLREHLTRESLEAMVSLHDQVDNASVREKIEAIVRGISNPDAYDTLADIVSDHRFPLTDPLTAAAVESMADLDTPAAVNRLLQRLNEATPDEDIQSLFLVLAQVNQPEARPSLELAAQGMKEVENPTARAAAIYALRNYLDETTLSLWHTLSGDHSDDVRNAAQQCLTWAYTQRPPPSRETFLPGGD